jgi:hypothetical protein
MKRMPLAWKGRLSRRWKTRSAFSSKAISCVPRERRRWLPRMAAAATGSRRRRRVGLVPGQAEQHRLVAAVALAGGAERAVELGTHARRACELAVVGEAKREQARGAHRPDGVRAAGPMPILKRSKTDTAIGDQALSGS